MRMEYFEVTGSTHKMMEASQKTHKKHKELPMAKVRPIVELLK